jgi:hypothetical protein
MVGGGLHGCFKRQHRESQDYVSVEDASRIFWNCLSMHVSDDNPNGVSIHNVYAKMCVELGKNIVPPKGGGSLLETAVDNDDVHDDEQLCNESSSSPEQLCLLCKTVDAVVAFARGRVVVCQPCADARKLHHICLFDAAPGRNQEILVSMDDTGKGVHEAYNIGDGSSMSYLKGHLAKGEFAGKTFVCATGDPRAPLIAFKEAVETGNGVLSAGGFSVHRWFAETMGGVLDVVVTQPTR